MIAALWAVFCLSSALVAAAGASEKGEMKARHKMEEIDLTAEKTLERLLRASLTAKEFFDKVVFLLEARRPFHDFVEKGRKADAAANVAVAGEGASVRAQLVLPHLEQALGLTADTPESPPIIDQILTISAANLGKAGAAVGVTMFKIQFYKGLVLTRKASTVSCLYLDN